MTKRLLAFILASSLAISMNASVFASEENDGDNTATNETSSDVSDAEEAEPETSASTGEKPTSADTESDGSPENSLQNDTASEIDGVADVQDSSSEAADSKSGALEETAELFEEATINFEETSINLEGNPEIVDLSEDAVQIGNTKAKLTGETIELSKQRSGSALTNKYGIVSGKLTDSMDYYTFSSTSQFFSISKLVSSNSNYTMMLGVVDWTNGVIKATDYVTPANQQFMANIGSGDYAWVIQSKNGTVGSDYTLQYNMSIPATDKAIYVTDNLQKLYSIGNDKLKINNQVQNIDYKYDSEWDWVPPQGGAMRWQYIHVSMIDANVEAVHVGGAKYYASNNLYDIPHAIVLSLKPGGTLSHYFWQDPPYADFRDKDMYGIATPRAINLTDTQARGGHYLIYNLDTGKIDEFASGLIMQWTAYGDKHDFQIY